MREHTVKSYDEDLGRLRDTISRMGGMAENQLSEAVQALVKRDGERAAHVVQLDIQLDALEREAGQHVIRLLALRQPMAQDLRLIIASLKIASDLERIGDYAKNVAKRALALAQLPPVASASGIVRMSELTLGMLKDALDAYLGRDAEKAAEVWRRDEPVDEVYNAVFRELLTYMMEDARNITACTHLLFIAKNIERIGDHATNIAEVVYYAVRGEALGEDRPKGKDEPLAGR